MLETVAALVTLLKTGLSAAHIGLQFTTTARFSALRFKAYGAFLRDFAYRGGPGTGCSESRSE
jgi:hypothetical protein